jgi:hypothetical protein
VRVLEIDFKLAILVTSEFLHTTIESKKTSTFFLNKHTRNLFHFDTASANPMNLCNLPYFERLL